MDDRRKDEVAALRQAVKDSNISLEALSGALMQFAVHADERSNALEAEIQKQRKLSKYARRTWFEVMAYIFIVGLLVSDVARAYADNQWWGLVFWTTRHGDGGTSEWILRSVGFLWQAGLLFVMSRRSQVPEDLFADVPYAQVQREKVKIRRN